MSGAAIRDFFRSLFGSRFSAHLETEILQVRADCELRIRDKDDVIAVLRTEKAVLEMKVSEYERAIMPLQSRAGAAVVTNATKPTKPTWQIDPAAFLSQMPKTKWEQYQEDFYRTQESEEKAKEVAKE